jgi:hypothetical protein
MQQSIDIFINASFVYDDVVAFLQQLELFALDYAIVLLEIVHHLFLQGFDNAVLHRCFEIVRTVRQQKLFNRIRDYFVVCFEL